jgi:RND family efflux transporter MFP subunit
MKRSTKWIIALLVIAAVAAVVARRLQQRKLAAAVPAAVVLPLELGALDIYTVQPQPITQLLTVSGGLKAANSAWVKAKVAADLKALTVREGDAVKAGQVIGQLNTAEIDLRIQQAEQSALSARTQLDIAKRTLANNRALLAQGFISANGMETSVSNEAGARATYQSAVAAADLARKARVDAVLVAPINGVVAQRLAQPGERVGVDARVVEVVDLSRLELEAAVAPEDASAVQVGQTARLVIDGFAEAASAQVVRINPSTQSGTRAVTVYLALKHQGGLRQGLFARGAIELQRKTALAAPVSSVRIDQDRPYVLVVEGNKVAQRPVALGVRGEIATAPGQSEAVVELLSGVASGNVLLRASVGSVSPGTATKLTQPKVR